MQTLTDNKAVLDVKLTADALTDEVVELGNGNQQYIHHIDSDPKNKFVIGSGGKDRSASSHMAQLSEI